MFAGIFLVVLPSVMYGGLTLLGMLAGNTPGYSDNPLRQNLWRAGHAHAGVYLVLSLVMLRYVDEAALSPFWKWLARVLAAAAGHNPSTVAPSESDGKFDHRRQNDLRLPAAAALSHLPA
jgi:drug/metabolite transporter superfamily protein YnfA